MQRLEVTCTLAAGADDTAVTTMASGAGVVTVIASLRAVPARAAYTSQMLLNCHLLHCTDRSFLNDSVTLHEQLDNGTAVLFHASMHVMHNEC